MGRTMVLAGDLGGTKSNLALYVVRNGRMRVVLRERLPSARFAAAGELVQRFARGLSAAPDAVCLGVAGPMRGGRVEASNLPWVVSPEEIRAASGAQQVYLINDLVATGYGVLGLAQEEFVVLNPGAADAAGSVALIAAGTGLGQAVLVWDGDRYVAAASEGGHGDYAPTSEEEVELLHYLQRRHGHVSVERVLSGPGLHAVYRFLVDSGRGEVSDGVAARMSSEDPAAVIGDLGGRAADKTCTAALRLFARVYGAAAGNLALTTMATGGVYLCGGIAPKLLPVLQEGDFLRAFVSKGRMSDLLQDIPVRVVLDAETAVRGAGRYAAEKGGWLCSVR